MRFIKSALKNQNDFNTKLQEQLVLNIIFLIKMEIKLFKSKQHHLGKEEDFLNSQNGLDQVEKSVSILQSALFQFRKTKEELESILEEYQHGKPLQSMSFEELNQNITRRVNTTSFEGKTLLDGSFDIVAQGQVCRAIKMPLQIQHGQKIHVQALKKPIPSILYGSMPLTENLINDETHIGFYEGGKTAVYCIAPNETIESLLLGAQHMIFQKGLSLDLTITQEGFLKIQHCEKSQILFLGYSEKTPLISVAPGIMQTSKVGKVGYARINGIHALWEGNQITANGIQISCNGIAFNEDLLTVNNSTKWIIDNHKEESLYMQIPSMRPCDLSGILDDGKSYNMKQLPTLSQTSKVQTQKICQQVLKQMETSINQMETLIQKLQKTGFMLLAGKQIKESGTARQNRIYNEQAMRAILGRHF